MSAPRWDRTRMACERDCKAALPTLTVLWQHRRYYGKRGAGLVWVSMAGIAELTGKSAGTVAEHVRMLEQCHLLTRVVAGGQNRNNLYLLRGFERPPDDDLAAELVQMWGITLEDAHAELVPAVKLAESRAAQRRFHPSPRQARTCQARIERRGDRAASPGDKPPLRPAKSAQLHPRKSAWNVPSGRSTPTWSDNRPIPVQEALLPWSDAERAQWVTRQGGRPRPVHAPQRAQGWDRRAALVALRRESDRDG